MVALQGLRLLGILSSLLMLTLSTGQQSPKEVVVIGGGIAGLSAARHIINKGGNQFSVRVYEARRERYGGRVWTNKLKNPKARGLEVDMGAFALNVATQPMNPLLNLTRDLDLETASLSGPQFIVPWLNKKYSDDELWQAMVTASSVLSDAVNVTRRKKKDVSIRQAVDSQVSERGMDENSLETLLLKSFKSYTLPDYSALQYEGSTLDFGYKQVLLDGMGELMDRLVSGAPDERPLKVSLRTAVRQVKVDRAKGKVVLRLKDGSQVMVDEVVVAVPAPVIGRGDLLFEPALPTEYLEAVRDMGMLASNKIIVEFDAAFWPAEHGIFLLGVQDAKERGCLQAWLNLHKLLDKPFLMTSLSGDCARDLENMSEEDVQAMVLKKLQIMFGDDSVSAKNIVQIKCSAWISDQWAGAAGTYPRVGNSPRLWDMFAEPLCPYIHFAGEHTLFRGHGTLHGAYASGVRAAEAILSGHCAQKAAEEEKRAREEAERLKKKLEQEDGQHSETEKSQTEKEEEDSVVKDEL